MSCRDVCVVERVVHRRRASDDLRGRDFNFIFVRHHAPRARTRKRRGRFAFSAGVLRFQRALAIIFGGALVLQLVIVLAGAALPASTSIATTSGDVYAIGKLLFTDFLLPFEITSLLLLVAMVGVIVLAKKR
ncbi:MAG: NADH-quinone oxidoreductase subunit J [Chloroflexi bacterium]|nr:NADH-quinone oxidoreductase subunit J [Chloroflexota bacterium]